MSEIDERIVELKFDNKDFEKRVAQSIKTLEKLNSALGNKLPVDRFDDLSSKTMSVEKNMNSLGKSVEEVGNKFSTMEIISITAIAKMTNAAMDAGIKISKALWDPIINGGKNRALNIEAAKFQLQGLGIQWAQIEDYINFGVKDTAYGLDSAARVASQLVASGKGVKELADGSKEITEDMGTMLRAISGVAAMTNSSYDEIGHIFTTVAGNGRLMTMQLQQLANRGLNVAGELAKQYHVTEAELRDMVSKGKVSFEEFAYYMDEAFGSHAKEANQTFTGALANTKSALSRIGALFSDVQLNGMKNFFNDLIPNIDAVKNGLKFISREYETFWAALNKLSHNILFDETFQKGMSEFAMGITSYLRIFTISLRELIPITDETGVHLGEMLHNFAANMQLSESRLRTAVNIFKGLLSIAGVALNVIRNIGKIVGTVFKSLGRAMGEMLDSSGDLGYNLQILAEHLNYIVNLVGDLLSYGVEQFLNGVIITVKNIITALEPIKPLLNTIAKFIIYQLYIAIKIIPNALSIIFTIVEGIFNLIKPFLPSVKTIVSLISSIATVALKAIIYSIQTIYKIVSAIIKTIKEATKTWDVDKIKASIVNMFDAIKRIAASLAPVLESVGKILLSIVSIAVQAIPIILSLLEKMFTFIADILSRIDFGKISEFISAIFNTIANGLNGIGSLVDGVGNLFSSAYDRVSSFASGIVSGFDEASEATEDFAESVSGSAMEIEKGFDLVKSDTTKFNRDYTNTMKDVGTLTTGMLRKVKDSISTTIGDVNKDIAGLGSEYEVMAKERRGLFGGARVIEEVDKSIRGLPESVAEATATIGQVIYSALVAIKDFAVSIFVGIKGVLTSAFEWIKDFIAGIDMPKLIVNAFIGLLFYAIFTIISSIYNFFDSIASLARGFMFAALTELVTALTEALAIIVKIIGVLSLFVLVASIVPEEKIQIALKTLGAFFFLITDLISQLMFTMASLFGILLVSNIFNALRGASKDNPIVKMLNSLSKIIEYVVIGMLGFMVLSTAMAILLKKNEIGMDSIVDIALIVGAFMLGITLLAGRLAKISKEMETPEWGLTLKNFKDFSISSKGFFNPIASILKAMAVVMLAFTASIAVLSKIDGEKMWETAGLIAAFFLGILGFVWVFNKLMSDPTDVTVQTLAKNEGGSETTTPAGKLLSKKETSVETTATNISKKQRDMTMLTDLLKSFASVMLTFTASVFVLASVYGKNGKGAKSFNHAIGAIAAMFGMILAFVLVMSWLMKPTSESTYSMTDNAETKNILKKANNSKKKGEETRELSKELTKKQRDMQQISEVIKSFASVMLSFTASVFILTSTMGRNGEGAARLWIAFAAIAAVFVVIGLFLALILHSSNKMSTDKLDKVANIMKQVNKLLGKISTVMMSLSLSLVVIASFGSKLTGLQIGAVLGALGIMFLGTLALVAILTRTNASDASKASYAIEAIAKLFGAVSIMVAVLGLVFTIMADAKIDPDLFSSFTMALVAVVLSVGVLFAIMATLGKGQNVASMAIVAVVSSLVAISLLVATIGIIINSMAENNVDDASLVGLAATISGLIIAVAAMIGLVLLIAKEINDFKTLTISIIGLVAIIAMVGGIVFAFAELSESFNGREIDTSMFTEIADAIQEILWCVGIVQGLMTGIGEIGDTATMLISLIGIISVLAIVGETLSNLANSPGNFGGDLTEFVDNFVESLVELIFGMGIVASALTAIVGGISGVNEFAGSMSLGALAVVLFAITESTKATCESIVASANAMSTYAGTVDNLADRFTYLIDYLKDDNGMALLSGWMSDMQDVILEMNPRFVNLGDEIGRPIVEGMTETVLNGFIDYFNSEDVLNSLTTVGETIGNALKDGMLTSIESIEDDIETAYTNASQNASDIPKGSSVGGSGTSLSGMVFDIPGLSQSIDDLRITFNETTDKLSPIVKGTPLPDNLDPQRVDRSRYENLQLGDSEYSAKVDELISIMNNAYSTGEDRAFAIQVLKNLQYYGELLEMGGAYENDKIQAAFDSARENNEAIGSIIDGTNAIHVQLVDPSGNLYFASPDSANYNPQYLAAQYEEATALLENGEMLGSQWLAGLNQLIEASNADNNHRYLGYEILQQTGQNDSTWNYLVTNPNLPRNPDEVTQIEGLVDMVNDITNPVTGGVMANFYDSGSIEDLDDDVYLYDPEKHVYYTGRAVKDNYRGATTTIGYSSDMVESFSTMSNISDKMGLDSIAGDVSAIDQTISGASDMFGAILDNNVGISDFMGMLFGVDTAQLQSLRNLEKISERANETAAAVNAAWAAGRESGNLKDIGSVYGAEKSAQMYADALAKQRESTKEWSMDDFWDEFAKHMPSVGSGLGSTAAQSIASTSGAGSGINDLTKSGSSGSLVNSNNTTYNYFTQNNYSPESLSRSEIYQQTQRQLMGWGSWLMGAPS